METYLPLAGDGGGGAALGRGGCGKDEGGGRYGWYWYSHRGRFTGGGAKEVSAVAIGVEEGGSSSSSSSSEVAPHAAGEEIHRPSEVWATGLFFNRRNFDFLPSL